MQLRALPPLSIVPAPHSDRHLPSTVTVHVCAKAVAAAQTLPPCPVQRAEVGLRSTDRDLYDHSIPQNYSSINSKKVSIYNTIRSRVGRGWPTGALEYFNQNKSIFSDYEKSFLLSKISNGYYLANLDDKAIKTLGNESFIKAPYSEGLWIKGLAHYRKQEFEKSSKSFLILSL